MTDKTSPKDKMMDTLIGTLFQEITDAGVMLIRENMPKVVKAITDTTKNVYVAIKESGKSELKVHSLIRDSIEEATAKGCEIGYQAGRQQKMQLMLYGMSQAGLHIDQIKQIFSATKEAEEQFEDAYDTYEHYLATMKEIEQSR